MAQQFEILSGPSKADLMIALFANIDGGRVPVRFRVLFSSGRGYTDSRVIIDALEWKDRSGDHWNFKGYIVDPLLIGGGWPPDAQAPTTIILIF